jgi:peptide/nickel transport system permease protein
VKGTSGLRLARVLILLLGAMSLFADFLSPHHPETQNLERFFAPPTTIHFVDAEGDFHWRPFVYRWELQDPLDVVYREITDRIYPLQFFSTGYRYHLLGLIPTNIHLMGSPVETFYPLGTDELGRDVLSRILSGAKTSLLVVLVGITAYAIAGLVIGVFAGLLGGWTDAALMRLSEFVMAVPALYLILALRAMLPARLAFWQTLFLTVGTIAAVTWPPLARGVRGLILQLRNAGYVEAARSLGCTEWQILRIHMVPAVSSFLLTQAAVASPVFLLGEIVLSFLDVGFRDSGESWGLMLRNLKDPRVLTDFWWNLIPLAFVFVTLLCLNLLSNSLRIRRGGLEAQP